MPEQLEDSIRATAPRPDPAFLDDLERRVEAGFPKPARRRRAAAWRPAFALAACVLFGLVVAVGVLNEQSNDAVPLSGRVDEEQVAPQSRPAVPPASDESAGGSAATSVAPAPQAPVTPGSRRACASCACAPASCSTGRAAR